MRKRCFLMMIIVGLYIKKPTQINTDLYWYTDIYKRFRVAAVLMKVALEYQIFDVFCFHTSRRTKIVDFSEK